MGRLLASLIADSESETPATLATPATLVRKVAESQKSQASDADISIAEVAESQESQPFHLVEPQIRVAQSQESQGPATSLAVYESLERLASDVGADLELVRQIPAAQIDWIASMTDGTDAFLRSYLHVLRDDKQREASLVPDDETDMALCSRCGPVWISPAAAFIAPKIAGVPRVLGCPWCHLRARGLHVPRPPVTCGTCVHFERDTVNARAGLGRCRVGQAKGALPYPHAERQCAFWIPSNKNRSSR